MDLVDEQQRVGRRGLGDHPMEPVLEITAIAGACQQHRRLDRDHAHRGDLVGDLAARDLDGQPLGDRRLADAGISDEDQVRLGVTGQADHDPLEQRRAPECRPQHAAVRQRHEVASVSIEERRRRSDAHARQLDDRAHRQPADHLGHDPIGIDRDRGHEGALVRDHATLGRAVEHLAQPRRPGRRGAAIASTETIEHGGLPAVRVVPDLATEPGGLREHRRDHVAHADQVEAGRLRQELRGREVRGDIVVKSRNHRPRSILHGIVDVMAVRRMAEVSMERTLVLPADRTHDLYETLGVQPTITSRRVRLIARGMRRALTDGPGLDAACVAEQVLGHAALRAEYDSIVKRLRDANVPVPAIGTAVVVAPLPAPWPRRAVRGLGHAAARAGEALARAIARLARGLFELAKIFLGLAVFAWLATRCPSSRSSKYVPPPPLYTPPPYKPPPLFTPQPYILPRLDPAPITVPKLEDPSKYLERIKAPRFDDSSLFKTTPGSDAAWKAYVRSITSPATAPATAPAGLATHAAPAATGTPATPAPAPSTTRIHHATDLQP